MKKRVNDDDYRQMMDQLQKMGEKESLVNVIASIKLRLKDLYTFNDVNGMLFEHRRKYDHAFVNMMRNNGLLSKNIRDRLDDAYVTAAATYLDNMSWYTRIVKFWKPSYLAMCVWTDYSKLTVKLAEELWADEREDVEKQDDAK